MLVMLWIAVVVAFKDGILDVWSPTTRKKKKGPGWHKVFMTTRAGERYLSQYLAGTFPINISFFRVAF